MSSLQPPTRPSFPSPSISLLLCCFPSVSNRRRCRWRRSPNADMRARPLVIVKSKERPILKKVDGWTIMMSQLAILIPVFIYIACYHGIFHLVIRYSLSRWRQIRTMHCFMSRLYSVLLIVMSEQFDTLYTKTNSYSFSFSGVKWAFLLISMVKIWA